jgi:hypothetical protein
MARSGKSMLGAWTSCWCRNEVNGTVHYMEDWWEKESDIELQSPGIKFNTHVTRCTAVEVWGVIDWVQMHQACFGLKYWKFVPASMKPLRPLITGNMSVNTFAVYQLPELLYKFIHACTLICVAHRKTPRSSSITADLQISSSCLVASKYSFGTRMHPGVSCTPSNLVWVANKDQGSF